MKGILKKLKNTHGFSLVELSIVAMLSGFIAWGLSGFMKDLLRFTKRAQDNAREIEEGAFSNINFAKHFRQVGPSFNMLSFPADYPSGTSFFDYLPDGVCVERLCTARERAQDPNCKPVICGREFTLSYNTPEKFIVFLEEVSRGMPTTPLNPTAAFDVLPPQDVISAGRLAWNPDLFMNQLIALDPFHGTADQAWAEGSVLQLLSPYKQKIVPIVGIPNTKEPPRPISFIGRVQGTQLVRVASLPFLRNYLHPVTRRPINTPADFFLSLGRHATFAMVRPLRIIRMRMESVCVNNFLTGKLIVETFNGQQWTSARTVGENFSKVKFERPKITRASIRATPFVDRDPTNRGLASQERRCEVGS